FTEDEILLLSNIVSLGGGIFSHYYDSDLATHVIVKSSSELQPNIEANKIIDLNWLFNIVHRQCFTIPKLNGSNNCADMSTHENGAADGIDNSISVCSITDNYINDNDPNDIFDGMTFKIESTLSIFYKNSSEIEKDIVDCGGSISYENNGKTTYCIADYFEHCHDSNSLYEVTTLFIVKFMMV
ncbi:MAG: hypothetical protein MHPSP_001610, partial [Paramarteilia canceri]